MVAATQMTHLDELLSAKLKTRAAYNEAVRGGASAERIKELNAARWAAHHAYGKASQAPAAETTQASAPQVTEGAEGFEGLTSIRAGYWMHKCPFRGYPNTYELDERCPTTLNVIALPVRVKGGEDGQTAEDVPHIMPRLIEGEYCWTCVHDQVREVESGKSASTYRGKGTGIVRRRQTRRK